MRFLHENATKIAWWIKGALPRVFLVVLLKKLNFLIKVGLKENQGRYPIALSYSSFTLHSW